MCAFALLIIVNGSNASPLYKDSITVSLLSNPDITPANNVPLCSGSSQILTVNNTSSGTTYQWLVRTATVFQVISGATNSTLSVSAAGVYTCVITSGNNQDTLNLVTIITTSLPALPTISVNPNSIVCSGTNINFFTTPQGGQTYSWNFGDGSNNANGINVTHPFNTSTGGGTQDFTVALTTTATATGCVRTATQTVSVYQKPGATLNSDATTSTFNGVTYFKVCSNSTSSSLTFINTSSTTTTNSNYQIIWGDGSSDFNASTFTSNIPHIYSIGTYVLKFIVTGPAPSFCKTTTNYNVFVGTNPAIGMGNPGNTSICSGDSLTFPISYLNAAGNSNNAPGTIYTVVFNDGSAPVVFTHPTVGLPQPFITHVFNITSCNNLSGTYTNSFSVTITASNPCQSSTASIVPIYVSTKPNSDFSISSNDTLCQNSTATFTSNGSVGNIVDAGLDNGDCANGKLVWNISPATGWTIVSGLLGSDNGFPANPNPWTSGTSPLAINFNTPGIYNVNLNGGGNSLCGNDDTTNNICINPTPIADFSINNNIGCASLNVNTTNLSNSPLCGVNKYIWTVTYVPTAGCLPDTSNYLFRNGTNANSTNPQFRFISPGVYTIGLQVISPANACSTTVVTQTVTVKGKPVISIGGLASTLCVNQSINASSSASCYIDASTTYSWTFPGGTPATSTLQNPGNVTFGTAASPTISLSVTNSCGTTNATQPITINPTPTVNAVSSITKCAGQSSGVINFTGNQGATVYTWTNSNTAIGLASSGTGSIPTFNVTNNSGSPINSTITVSPSLNGCTGTSISFTITVNPIPSVTVNSPNICSGNSATLTASGADTYSWSPSTGLSATTGATVTSTATTTTNYFVTGTITATGCSKTVTSVVTVNTAPTITGTSSNPTSCASSTGSITINGLISGTPYTLNYSYNGTPQTAVNFTTSAGVTSYIISNLRSGTYSNITITYNGCASNALSFSLSDPNPPATPVVSPVNNICSGGTINLSASGSPAGSTYTWSGPNGFNSTLQNPTINNASINATGTYSVTATLNSCTSPSTTVTVTVQQTPVTPTASSNTPVCAGNSLTLSANTTSTMPVSWSWSGPNSYLASTQNTVVSNAATNAMAGTYTVTAIATYGSLNCPSSPSNTIVVINPTPVITGSNFTNPANCSSSTGSIQLSGLTSGINYGVHYTNPSSTVVNLNIIANGSGNIIITNLPAGTYSNVYVTQGICPSATVGPFNIVDPNPPTSPVVSPVNDICSGGTINLSASGSPTGSTYTWSGPNSFSSTLQNPTINNASINSSGTYSVTSTLSGCASPATTVTVTVQQTPATPTASSNTPVCSGNSLTLSASTTSTMPVTWSWGGPNSFVSTTQNPVVSNTATTNMSGNYSVIATATYGALSCPSLPGNATVVVNPTPVISGSSSTDPTNCATPTGTIILNGLTVGTSYTVNYTGPSGPRTVNLSANASGTVTITGLLAGTYNNVYVVLTNCPSSSVGPFSLSDPNPPPAPVVPIVAPICEGEQLNLNASTSSLGTPTWNWTGPNGFNNTQQNPVITSAQTAATGTYNVTVTISSCTSPAQTVNVVVNPRPVAPVVTSPVVYCQFDIPVPLTATALTGHTLQWYTVVTGGLASNTAPTPSTNSTGTVTYYVSQVTPENCEGQRARIDVIVNSTPVVTPQTQTKCSGTVFSITPTGIGVPANTVYSWGLPIVTGGLTGGATGSNATIISGSLSNPTDFVQTATYTVTPTSGSCPGNAFTVIITVNPAPHVTFTPGNQSICSGSSSLSVTITSPTPGVSIPWIANTPIGITGVQNSGNNTIPAQLLINNTANPITVIYSAVAITAGASGCQGDTSRYNIIVNPKPLIPAQTSAICSHETMSLAPSNNAPTTIVPNGTTYTWTYIDNPNVTGESNQTTGIEPIRQTLINTTNIPQQVVYTITPTSGAAGSCVGNSFQLTVTVNPVPEIPTLSTTICSGNSFTVTPVNGQPNLNTIVPAGTTYSWTAPALPAGISGAISGTNQINIFGSLSNTTFAPITITYIVTPTSGASGNCPGIPFNVDITINPRASINNNPLNQNVCNGNTTTSVNWTSYTSGSSYSWTVVSSGNVTGFLPAGAGNTLGTMTLTNTGIAQDSVVYAISSTASACAGPATNYTIYVNPDAKANFSFPYDTACWPYAIIINNTSALSPGNPNIPNGSYNWYTINNAGISTFIGTGSTFPGYTIIGPSESIRIKMIAISAFGCKKDSLSHTFYTKPKPTANFTMSNRDSCGPLTVSFVNHTNIIDTFRYLWNFGNGQTSTLINPVPVTFLSNPRFYDTTYYIILKAFNECDTSTYIDSVIVRADPKARFFLSSTSGCSPFTIQITNTSLGNAYEYYWDFGNGIKDTTYSNGTFSYIYYTGVVDTFKLMLIAQNQCGRDTAVINVRVAPNIIRPGVSINATELYGCVAHTVNFINSTSGASNFTWDFGDGSSTVVTSVFQNIVQHIYNTPGTFNVNIGMTNGCSDTSITKQVIVYPRPTAAFNSNQSVYCLGDTIHVTNASQNAGGYLWNWGTGPTNGGFQPSHVYTLAGTYTILLQAQVTAPTGVVCYDTVSHPITVLNKPDSTLITNISNANCAPFDFTASTPGIINETVVWYVYDTTAPGYPIIFNGPSLQYTFNNPGTFSIQMIAENAAGCKDSTKRTFTVYQKPNAGFTPLNLSTCSLDTLVGYNNTTTANNYTPLTYKWYVDGIQRATTGNFNYRYITLSTVPLPRTFITKLIAKNSVGCADSVSGTLQINPTAKSIFSITNPNACIPFIANIADNSIYATDYKWYLNGVFYSNSPTPSINITTANTSYTITLIVSNIYACKPDTSTFTFRTRIMPKAIFSVNNSLGCTGQLNIITTNNSQNANAYEWEWGDGTANSILTNPTHLFTSVGIYRITLTAKDGVCTDTTSKLVTVALKPVVSFNVNNSKNCDTSRIHLINLTANADSYLWILSNGITSTGQSPFFTLPPSNTPYTVQLIAYNNEGCRDSLTKANYIKVFAPPVADFYINPAATISIPNYTFSFTNLTLNSILYKYDWSLGDGRFEITRDIASHLYPDTGSYDVRLIVMDTSTNCTDTVIKIARIEGYPGFLFVANAFYPNSIQTQFKSFKPLGKGLAEYELQIFDSWGKLLFKTTRLDIAGIPVEGWDGTFNGKPMPQDAYAWYIKAKFRNGKVWGGMQYDQNQNGAQGHTFGTITLFR